MNDNELGDLLTSSFHRFTGRQLVPDEHRFASAAEWLYEAPFGLLAHDTSSDPLFIYANLRAQRFFGYTWDEFAALPSRLSANEHDQRSRDALMNRVRRHGYADGYRGLRVNKDGHSFWIENVTIWNLVLPDGSMAGQAALIPSVTCGTGERPKI